MTALPPRAEEAVLVQVLATSTAGEHRLSFRMRPATPFVRLMNAWCTQFKIPLDRARFELDGRELDPEDTPIICGLSASSAPVLVRAAPRKAVQTAGPLDEDMLSSPEYKPESGQEDEDDSTERSDSPDSAASTTSSSTPTQDRGRPPLMSPRKRAATLAMRRSTKLEQRGARRRVQFRVIARSDRGDNAVVITLPTDAPLQRLMAAWCDYHSLSRDAARFALATCELSGTDTVRKLVRSGAIPRNAVPAARGEVGLEVTVRAAPRTGVRGLLAQPLP